MDRVRTCQFHGVNGTTSNPEETLRKYAELLRQHNPQWCLLGIGDNGHVDFKDPAEANFDDPLDIKIVSLHQQCQQQVNEGWSGSVAEVPIRAITLMTPTLLRVPRLIATVPGERKAHIVHRTLAEEISTDCLATIMRKHPDTTVYLDPASSTELPLE